jgi:hypothetical protein
MKTYLVLLSVLIPILASADAIEDNSFFIEEAYNQEPGVVQFINTYQYSEVSKEWMYSLTNEFPFKDETNQLSYTLPFSKKGTDSGLGDIGLNYRYQLVKKPGLAMAPRFSIVLPTGDSKKNLGAGAVGLQFNHSVSIKVDEKWMNHWNLGFAYTPHAKNSAGDEASLFNFNFGMSTIYLFTEKTNFLVEFVVNGNETVTGPSAKERSTSYLVVPGVRTAFQAGENTEIVPGLAAILGIGPSAETHERGLFVYFSIEPKLW